MPANERRSTRRFIMRVPLRFRPMKQASIPEESAASMNISTHGVYFATATKVSEGVEPLGTTNGKSGIGVQFLYYEVPPATGFFSHSR